MSLAARLSLGHGAPTTEASTSMSEIKRAGDAIKRVKAARSRMGSAADRLLSAHAALDAAAGKVEAEADRTDADEKEITALLAELGSNFPPDEAEVAPKKKGILGI
jgi:DNA repair ATPase RecN